METRVRCRRVVFTRCPPSKNLLYLPVDRGEKCWPCTFCAVLLLDRSHCESDESPHCSASSFVGLPLGVKSIEYLRRQHCHIFKLSVQVLSLNFCSCESGGFIGGSGTHLLALINIYMTLA